MRILVTGSQGQLARCLSDLNGREPGLEIVTIGRPELDVSKPDTLKRAIERVKPDSVINAAAYTDVDKAEDEEELAYAINAAGAGNTAVASRAAGIPLIHISTDYVFDGIKDGAYVENDPVNPMGAYGRTKLQGEKLVQRENPNHTILRTSWVFSTYGKNFVTTMLRLAGDRKTIPVVDDQHGNPTHAGELAKACVAVARHLAAKPENTELRGVFHFAGAETMSWADLAERIMAASIAAGGPSAEINRIASSEFQTRANRPKNSKLDTRKVRSRFGLKHSELNGNLSEICQSRYISGRKTVSHFS